MALPARARPRVDHPVRESVRVLGLYLRAQVLIALALTVLYAVAFYLAHVPLWLFIALVGGVASLIPRVGGLIPLGLAALTILWVDANLVRVAVAFGAWVAIQAIEGFVLQPLLLGRPLGLSPLLVFLVLVAGSLMFGPIGFLLAVPVFAIGRVFWHYLRDRSAHTGPQP